MNHSNVIAHLQEVTRLGQKIRVSIPGRKAYLFAIPHTELGWIVRLRDDPVPYVLQSCEVRYDKQSRPTFFTYRAERAQTGVAPEVPSKLELTPRNPDWNATLLEDEKEARKNERLRVSAARRALLAAPIILETVFAMRESLEWLRAIEQQAQRANSPAAEPIANVCARLERLLQDVPK